MQISVQDYYPHPRDGHLNLVFTELVKADFKCPGAKMKCPLFTLSRLSFLLYACWMLSAGAMPAFIANQMDHENAGMVYTVYSAWINALDGDRIAFLNQRIGGYNSVPQVPPEEDAH